MENQVITQLHTLGVVSAKTSMSRSALYREIKSGRLSALKIGKSLRVSEEDLQAFLSSLHKTKVEA